MPVVNNIDISASQGVQRGRLKQVGERTVRHVGGRVQAGAGTYALVAAPVLPGESLDLATFECFAASDSHVQPDSPMQCEWLFIFQPFDFISNVTGASIAETSLNAWLDRATGGEGTGQQYGGDPDAATEGEATELFQMGMRAQEILWDRNTILTAEGLHTSVWNGVGELGSSHPWTKFNVKLTKNRYFPFPGYLIFGVRRYDMTAQTNFNVVDYETGFADESWQHVLGGDFADYADFSVSEKEVVELLYGGDTYIEADTWKTDAVRLNVLAQFKFNTPWPEARK